MASWSRCNRHGSGQLQTIYINLDHVITVERVNGYTLIKFPGGSETVVEQPEIVVCAIQSADERRI
jgi:hypothetical protein